MDSPLNVFFHPQESKWAGIEYCVMLVVVGFIGAICETHTYFHLNNAGIKMKTALISAIYRKSLKMLQPNGKLRSWTWRSDKFKSKLSNLHTSQKNERNSFLFLPWESNFFEKANSSFKIFKIFFPSFIVLKKNVNPIVYPENKSKTVTHILSYKKNKTKFKNWLGQ